MLTIDTQAYKFLRKYRGSIVKGFPDLLLVLTGASSRTICVFIFRSKVSDVSEILNSLASSGVEYYRAKDT